MPFLEFVEHHPVGTSVNGTVESYSSHGAYISIGASGVRGYVPLRLMADPPPPSARKVMQIGESVTLVVVSFAPLRRSIDCAVPDMAKAAIAAARAEQQAAEHEPSGSGGRTPASKKAQVEDAPAVKKAASPKKTVPAAKDPVKKASAKTTSATQKVAPAKATRKSPATKAVAVAKAPAKKAAAPAKATPVRKSPAKTAAATKQPAAKKSPAKKAAPTEKAAPTKQSAAKKAPAQKAPAQKAAAKKAPAKKAPAKSAANGG
jgi:ribosomal protein S1